MMLAVGVGERIPQLAVGSQDLYGFALVECPDKVVTVATSALHPNGDFSESVIFCHFVVVLLRRVKYKNVYLNIARLVEIIFLP